MVLTTKEASYIIVLGIVISLLPISSTGNQLGTASGVRADMATCDCHFLGANFECLISAREVTCGIAILL